MLFVFFQTKVTMTEEILSNAGSLWMKVTKNRMTKAIPAWIGYFFVCLSNKELPKKSMLNRL